MPKPIVAIVGRPNVGKSTLFNRIVGRRQAIVEDLPGTTRDRLCADFSWKGRQLSIMDTGGLEFRPESGVRKKIREQIEAGIAEAALVLFVLDLRDGLLADDWEVAEVLRRSGKPMILVANKAEGPKQQNGLLQMYELGMGEPLLVSAYHGRGVEDLLDKVIELVPDASSPAEESIEAMKVAIVGRPNVGKSLLLNALVGEQRVIVDDTPGTTRDAVDTVLKHRGKYIILVDTAGIRRRGRVEQGVEQYSVIRGREAIERSDVTLLVIDATEGLSSQDVHILGYAKEAYKSVVIVVNKWDLVVEQREAAWRRAIIAELRFMPYLPILFTSAKTDYGVKRIMPALMHVYKERLKLLPDEILDSAIRDAVEAHPPPALGAKHIKISKVTQSAVNPPTFVFRVTDPKLVHFTYKRYLENSLRQRFGFEGTPLRLVFSGKGRKPRDEQEAAKP